jgi:hypothetical protein
MGQAAGAQGCRQRAPAAPRRGLVWAVPVAETPPVASADVVCTKEGWSQMAQDFGVLVTQL